MRTGLKPSILTSCLGGAKTESHRITSLFVCEGERLIGIVHLHDLWRLELF